MRSIHVFCGLALMAGSGAAQAASDSSRFKLAVSFGSLGVGPEVTYRPSRYVGARAMATVLAVQHTRDIDGVTYKGKLKLGNYGLMLDVYPLGGGFRISAGARYADNRFGLTGRPSGPTRIGNTTYTPAQIGTLSGTITTRKWEPIATIGYGGTVARGVSLGIDVGVMYQGKPRMSPLTATGAVAQADLTAERANIQDDIDKYKYYPVVQVSAGYRF